MNAIYVQAMNAMLRLLGTRSLIKAERQILTGWAGDLVEKLQ